ncbi:hypothetical protein BJP35_2955 [Enterobacter sp. J49]|nr:hypothetical protein BJP35_2955 [Enterobacter sp. J49]
MFHLPILLYALPCKVKRAFPVFRIQVIEHLNQLFAASIRRVLIEKVERGPPLAEEVTQHYSGVLVTMAILPDFIQALYAALMILGKKNRSKKTGHRARFCSHTKKALKHSIHDSPASVQSSDRAHATGGKVQLNHYYSRATKWHRGISVHFRESNHPARQTTDSHRPPASASTGRHNIPPRSRRRRYGRSILSKYRFSSF